MGQKHTSNSPFHRNIHKSTSLSCYHGSELDVSTNLPAGTCGLGMRSEHHEHAGSIGPFQFLWLLQGRHHHTFSEELWERRIGTVRIGPL